MSRFKQLVLESAYEVLVEAPAKASKPLDQNIQQPSSANDGPFYIKAFGHKMKAFANDVVYFAKFETEQNGQKRPLFYDEEYKDLAQKFDTKEEANRMIQTIYSEAPMYKDMYQNMIVVPENEETVNDNDQEPVETDKQPQENPEQNSNEEEKMNFKNWLDQQKAQIGNVFQKMNDTGKNAVATVSAVLSGKPTGDKTIDSMIVKLKDTINKVTPKNN